MCTLLKVMERIIKDHLLAHLQEHDLLYFNQYGFLPIYSTTSQVLECLFTWSHALDTKQNVDTIILFFRLCFALQTVSQIKGL